MSAREQPGRVTAYVIQCDAVDCDNELIIVADKMHGDEVIAVSGGWDDGERYWACHNVRDAVSAAVDYGWQEGTKGIQRGHVYCPDHKEETK